MLSGGQRKRIIVAMALATDADVIFLDEPTAGLDPLARRRVWKSLREMVVEGHTILLTTHYLNEADALADHVFILNKGKIAASGSPSELKTLLEGRFKIVLEGKGELSKLNEYGRVLTVGDHIAVYPNNEEKLKQLIDYVTKIGLPLPFN